MVDFIHLGILSIVFLMILAIVSNVNQTSINNIEDQIFLMNCPLPIYEGVASGNPVTLTPINITGFSVEYFILHNRDINGNSTSNDQDKVGTEFDCNANNGLFGASVTTRQYGITLFNFIPYGFVGYLADWLSHTFENLSALFVLISYFISPLNFNILNITIADLSGIALFFVIGIYAFCYVSIGIMLYKVLSPFSGE